MVAHGREEALRTALRSYRAASFPSGTVMAGLDPATRTTAPPATRP